MFINELELVMPEVEGLILVPYTFDLSNYNSRLFQQMNINFPEVIKSSVIKRQAEYLAGRYAARSALNNLGVKVNDIAIGMHRSPVWPSNVSASITHTNSRVICAASYKADYEYLGIDLEKRLSKNRVIEIKNSIIDIQEEALILRSQLSFEDAFSLIFSAKESLFKALYPSVRAYFDFSSAKFTAICCNTNSFTLTLLDDLTPELSANIEFNGHFIFDKSYVLTIIAQ